MITKYQKSRHQRKIRIREKIKRTNPELPRLSVFRSDKHFYAQIIDVLNGGKVLAAVSDNDLKNPKGRKTEKAAAVGEILAVKAKNKKINKIVFDRSGYAFSGRVRALAESLRKGGLKF